MQALLSFAAHVSLSGSQAREARCRAAQDGLAARIAEYRPLAIVALLLGIRDIV